MTRIQTKALIFDMDGTMVDSIPHHKKSLSLFCERHRICVDIDDLMRRTNGRNGAETMRELFQHPLEDDEAWALIREKETIYREIFSPVFKEIAGFKNFTAQARALGLKIGVGTAGDIQNVEFVLRHLQMNPAPDAIARGDEGLTGKPTPAIFLEAAKRIKIAAEHCIVFEDAPFGIEAARRAGMRAVAICSTHSAAELAGPHVIASVSNYNELDPHFLSGLTHVEHA